MRRLHTPLPYLGALLISLFIFTACEESGIVGSSFVTTDPSLVIDTLMLDPIETEALITFSGTKTYVAAGSFNDQLFGTYTATALLNPTIYTGVQEVQDGAQYTLVLIRDQITGDTTGTASFELHEISRRWRANEWKSDSVATVNPVPLATFETGSNDTIRVSLPQSWVDRYTAFLELPAAERLAAYQDEMFGFTISQQSGNRLEYFLANSSFLEIQNPEVQGEDTPAPFAVNMFQRATSYTMNLPMPDPADNRLIVMNDFSQTARLTIRINPDDYPINNISRAEIVLHEDFDILQSSLLTNERRFNTGQIRIFQIEEDEKEFYITKGPLTTIQRDTEGRYRIGLTSFINNAVREGVEEITLYFVSDQDNGIIRPNMFINAGAPDRAPKLIITTLTPN